MDDISVKLGDVIQLHRIPQTVNTEYSINSPFDVNQIVVFNDTPMTLYIGIGSVTTENYLFRVISNRYFVSPKVELSNIKVITTGTPSGKQSIDIYLYRIEQILNPYIYAIQ